ncbi:endo-1,4-beta-xylanase 5-like [Salvia divinorum]|uniref:Endo-1,4-beta-xylanase 5-like n=1 Tax=Salvia divinorum TaxID=28513 RepID=A0ABD1HRS9_SALDI
MLSVSNSIFFTIFALIIFLGHEAHAVPYDYTYTAECLAKPLKPQYNGGAVVNAELNEGLTGWSSFGESKIEHKESSDGNKYIVASTRNLTFHSFSQVFNLDKEKLYTFSGWFQVSHGKAEIAAVIKTEASYEIGGWVTAQSGCWSMLKGGFAVNVSGSAHLHFQSDNTAVDIWADSISLQPFSKDEWKSHQVQSIQKARKTRVRLQAVDQHGRPLANATVSIKQRSSAFPFGCAINQNILGNTGYQNWFFSRFKYTVFENELKWYSTEQSRGAEDYSTADAIVNLARSRGVAIRGHNVFWEDPQYQPPWVGGLPPSELRNAAVRRINAVVRRYRGKFIHWDVVNENLHFGLFESKLGPDASRRFYQTANKIDGRATPFLNDYNTIEDNRDAAASPSSYLRKIAQLKAQGYKGPLGIGLEGHFSSSNLNLPYLRSAIDALSSARLPIWITELDVKPGPNQASYLEQVMWEIHSHSSVQGIVIWSAWSPQGCYRMCLTDNNFRNLATGDVVDRFRSTLRSTADSVRTTYSDGFFEASLFHGEYEANITGDGFSDFRTFDNGPNEELTTMQFKLDLS